MSDNQPTPNISQQLTQINENILKLSERVGQVEARLDTKADNDVLLKLYQHMEDRFEQQQQYLDRRFDRIDTVLDGITARLDTDDQERAAIISEQRRHGAWIRQLADHGNVKLVPEQ